MKVGLVCPYNIFRGGGVQECVLALQRELTKRGHSVYIITPKPKTIPKHNLQNLELVGTATDVKSLFHTTAQGSISLNPKELDAMLAKHKFDLLHFHEPWVPLLSWQILSKASCPNVATFHAKLPETVLSNTIKTVITPYTRSVLKSLDLLTAVSPAASEYVETLTEQKPVIVPNGIDIAKYAGTTPQERDKNMILYVGRLEKRKGVKYLLAAFAELATKNPDVKLLIAGEGPESVKLRAYTKEHHIPRVSFLGHIDEPTKLELLRKAAIFCSPALYGESFGIVLLEAMATGAVAVAGNNSGYQSVMHGRGSMSIINPRDKAEFVRRLELMLHDQSVRDLWQQWAHDYVQQYDYTVVATSYEKVYQQALKAHNKH